MTRTGTLLVTAFCLAMLGLGFGLSLVFPDTAQAKIASATSASCSTASCHPHTEPVDPSVPKAIEVAVQNVTQVTPSAIYGGPIAANSGDMLEIDWKFIGVGQSGNTSPVVWLPSGWTLAAGTVNSPPITLGTNNWSTAWDASTGEPWWAPFKTTDDANAPEGWMIDYTTSVAGWGNSSGVATNDGLAGDLDTWNDEMGCDARITIPGGTPTGTYYIWVFGSGKGAKVGKVTQQIKASVGQMLTLNVTGAANANPNAPTNLAQYKNDGTTLITDGGLTNETTVKIEADISDPDGGNTVKLQVDLDSNGTFDCESALLTNPSTNVQVACTVVDANSYDWQVRTVDNIGATSAWTPYPNAGTDFTVDTTLPTLSPVTIASNNADSARAKTGDTVTLTFTSSESVSTPTATISGQAASVSGGPTAWTATRILSGVETEGALPFAIDFTDLAGNAGTQVTATTDASSVTFDKTAPSVSPPTTPANGATGVTLDSNVTIDFTENVKCSTVNTTNITSDSPGWAFFSCSGSQAIFTTSGQATTTTYNVNVTTAVTDLAGNALSAAYPFSYETAGAANTAPNAPADHDQYKNDGVTLITQGGTTDETTVKVKATVSDTDLNTVQLQVEIIDNGSAFSGTPNFTSGFVASGSVATVSCTGLTDTVAYKWRVRTFDGTDYSAWTDYDISDPDVTISLPVNAAPDAPVDHDQYKMDGTTLITQGGTTNQTTVVVKATVTDSDAGTVQLQVEILDNGSAYSGTENFTSGFVTSGTVATVSCTGLTDTVAYKWRVRTFDGIDYSAWTIFGGSDPDVTIDLAGATNVITSCGDCHAYPPADGARDGATGAVVGDHLAHNAFTCVTCHADDSGYAFGHRDGDININPTQVGGGGDNGSYTGGITIAQTNTPTPGSCNNVDCHLNQATPNWGDPAGITCVDCHVGYPAPPATAAHATHAGSGIGEYGYACTLCHPQDHDGDATDIAFTGLAATWGGATYTAAGKTCSNLYCHGSATADWDGLTGGACGDCHGAATTGRPDGVNEPSGGSHLSTTHAASACTDCHSHDGTNTTEHVNGPANATGDALVSAAGAQVTSYTYNVASLASSPDPDGYKYSGGTCATSCHTTLDWGATGSCNTCHTGYPEPPATAAHATHAGTANYAYSCNLCHPQDHDGDATDIVFSGIAATWGTETYSAAQKQCSNLYCHGSVTADWDGLTGGACGDCHGDVAGRPDGASEPANGSHLTTSHQVACTNCHSHDGTDKTEHANGVADTNGAALVSGAGTSIGSYTYGASAHLSAPDPDGYLYTGGTCATIACHNNNSASWGGGPLGCTDCHGNPPATAAHLTHAGSGAGEYGYACTLCHPQDHDGVVTDITFSGIAATWGGATYTSGVKTCATVYCHGSATADWDAGSGGTCGDCHGAAITGRPDGANEPASGNHLTTSHQVACTNCHSHDGTDTTEHANGLADTNGAALVSAAGTSIGGYTYGGTAHVSAPDPDGYDYTGGTCATIACHNNNSATWGGGPLGCTDCHGNPPATAAHLTHAGGGVGEYGYACTLCHPQDHDGVVTDIAFTGIAAGGTYSSAQKQCSNLYCHGSTTADWDGGTGGACGDCHGEAVTGRPDGVDEPSGGSHLTASHVVACTTCHSHDGSDTTEHVNGPANANGDALVSNAGTSVTSYTYGTTLASSPDPDGFAYSGGTCANSCHGASDWGGTGGCTTCHNGGGPDALLVSADSTHSTNTLTGSPTCESCHFDNHTTRLTGTVAVTWDSRTMGTDYTADGKIYLKKYLGTETYEAEVCWNCHNAQATVPAEFNNTGTAYKMGTLGGGTAVAVNWIGATWTSANFSYKNNTIESVHETAFDMTAPVSMNPATASHSNVPAAGDVANISCSSCHDVHSIDHNGYTTGAAPYLRGSWISNPFPEDGAPQNTSHATVFGGVPRAGLDSTDVGATPNALGGWQIEQNNPGAYTPSASYATFGGLCSNCHTQASLEGMTWKGHNAAVDGFNNVGASNIFTMSIHGGTTSYLRANMQHQGVVDMADAGSDYVYGLRESRAGGGINPQIPIDPKAADVQATGVWAAMSFDDTATPDADFHNFPCSKCHNPHASRLPRLMITNCLDVVHNTWDDTQGDPSQWGQAGKTYTAKQLAYSPTAVNCHRYVDPAASANEETNAGAENGWNSVTPW